MMPKLQVLVLPEVSVAVVTTVLVPTENAELLGGMLTTPATPQLSLLSGALKSTTMLVTLAGTFVTMSAHGPMVGTVVSTTMICALQAFELPLSSKQVSVTLLVPLPNGPPEINDRLVMVPSLSNEPASTANAATVAWQLASALTVTLL